MKYHSYKEWKELGYIVKKGEHATKVDDDYENTYLFSEEQVIPINSEEDKNEIQRLKELLKQARYFIEMMPRMAWQRKDIKELISQIDTELNEKEGK